MAKPKEPTKDCPDCGGSGVRQVRYTDPETTCPTCNGNGVVAADAEVAQDVEDASTAAKPGGATE